MTELMIGMLIGGGLVGLIWFQDRRTQQDVYWLKGFIRGWWRRHQGIDLIDKGAGFRWFGSVIINAGPLGRRVPALDLPLKASEEGVKLWLSEKERKLLNDPDEKQGRGISIDAIWDYESGEWIEK